MNQIRILPDGEAPTEPGWYACRYGESQSGRPTEDILRLDWPISHLGEDGGPLVWTTSDGYEMPMPENALWSRRIEIVGAKA